MASSRDLDRQDLDSQIGEDEEDQAEAWDDWLCDDEEDDSIPNHLCLFCDSMFCSANDLFAHCSSAHSFDFRGIVRDAGLDLYGSIKLINYVRAQVAENKCWSCGVSFQSNKDLQNHLHAAVNFEKDGILLWEDELYLRPFMEEDRLLHSFASDDDEEDDTTVFDKEEVIKDLMDSEDMAHLAELCKDDQSFLDIARSELDVLHEPANGEHCIENLTSNFEKLASNGTVLDNKVGDGTLYQKQKHKQMRVSFSNIAEKQIKNVNDSYFGAYGSFGIHREMISDTVRMDAYRGALLNNPSLIHQATVMDVGCGTGILSLFAAQAGASRVIAVEASVKMASVATQIVKNNGLLLEEGQNGEEKRHSGVINVVQGMIEELDKFTQIVPHSVDVLVSEWMGYCLLYESMLSSVLYARDRWLKPGGAILPDTATIFVAGFGRGGTSLPFWEDVYGFNMSCIGKEVVEDAARLPIVDILDSQSILTESVVLQFFDLATMKPDEMDFTSICELKLKPGLLGDSLDAKSGASWCHGIVLWFETGFTSRFCKETPTVLSTSPYSKSTHWSQTIFTFQEPIAMGSAKSVPDPTAAVGTEGSPAVSIRSRISIARSSTHRSIDISLETSGISLDGRKRSWSTQFFNL